MVQIKKASLSRRWYSCQRWSLLAAELSSSGKASQEPELSSGSNRRVTPGPQPQSVPVKDSSLCNAAIMTTLGKLRLAPAHTHVRERTHLGFVQSWQNLSKLNYEAICRVFDVIKIEASH